MILGLWGAILPLPSACGQSSITPPVVIPYFYVGSISGKEITLQYTEFVESDEDISYRVQVPYVERMERTRTVQVPDRENPGLFKSETKKYFVDVPRTRIETRTTKKRVPVIKTALEKLENTTFFQVADAGEQLESLSQDSAEQLLKSPRPVLVLAYNEGEEIPDLEDYHLKILRGGTIVMNLKILNRNEAPEPAE